MTTRWNRSFRPHPATRLVFAALGVLAPTLGGCVANSSNPSVVVVAAWMDDHEALVDLDVANPGGRNLVVREVAYELSQGEAGLPVAEGRWHGVLPLKAGARERLAIRIPFSLDLLEPDSRRIHLNGVLRFQDRTGYLGLGFMDLTSTSFQVEAVADSMEEAPSGAGRGAGASGAPAVRATEVQP